MKTENCKKISYYIVKTQVFKYKKFNSNMNNLFCKKGDLSNEDSVEKFFIDRLIKNLNFSDNEIKTKKSLKELSVSKGRKKENYKPDYVLYKEKKPVIVIEAKATDENIIDFEYQTLGYAFELNKEYDEETPVEYCVLSNGYLTNLYKWDKTKPILSLKFEDFTKDNDKYKRLINILSKDEIGKNDNNESEFEFNQISSKEVDGLFTICHNIIWKKETKNPTIAFYEFCKLFFIKLKQDKDIYLNYKSKNMKVPKEEFKFSSWWIDKYENDFDNPVNDILFKKNLLPYLKKGREEHHKKRIFEDNENINLTSSTIKKVVKLLEHVDFYGIDEDLNGRMFETFLSATIRGKDLGQFFTPRSVVKFMVKMANIKVSKEKEKIQKVFDGCCGSGGFLIDAMSDMIEKARNIESLSNEEFNNLKDYIIGNCIYGIDKSEDNTRVSRMNLWFHGDGSSNVYCLNTLDKQIRYDKSLNEERKEEIEEFKDKIKKGLKFDVILTNPPFSTVLKMEDDDEKEILEDYLISYKNLDKSSSERVSSLKSNVLFIERYTDLLEKGGKLLTVIDESILNTEQDKTFRDFILKNYIVKAIISLPRNSFVNAETTTKTSILYLRKKLNPNEEQPPIFMAMSQNIGHSDSGRQQPENCDLFRMKDKGGNIINSSIKNTILEEFEKWENGK